jgi:hypothetical protein
MERELIKVCRLIDGTFAVGVQSETHLLNSCSVYVDSTDTDIPRVMMTPFMYPFSQEVINVNIPLSKVLCLLDTTPEDIRTAYTEIIEAEMTPEPAPEPKKKATITRIK